MLTGYYCPQNSSSPTPCPAGRYNAYSEGKSINDCELCPVNHFNKWEAQEGCYFCGGQAFQSERGQTTCDCTGSGRDFQVINTNIKIKITLPQEFNGPSYIVKSVIIYNFRFQWL